MEGKYGLARLVSSVVSFPAVSIQMEIERELDAIRRGQMKFDDFPYKGRKTFCSSAFSPILADTTSVAELTSAHSSDGGSNTGSGGASPMACRPFRKNSMVGQSGPCMNPDSPRLRLDRIMPISQSPSGSLFALPHLLPPTLPQSLPQSFNMHHRRASQPPSLFNGGGCGPPTPQTQDNRGLTTMDAPESPASV